MQPEDQKSTNPAKDYAKELQDLLDEMDDDGCPTVAESGNDIRDKQRELKASRKEELKDWCSACTTSRSRVIKV